MNNNINKFDYRQLNSKQLTVSENYQRALDKNRVRKIVANFDPRLVNPIKVSHREGQYFVFDGQHTLAALKLKNGNADLMVDCKVYEGLTDAEEAVLFSEQNGLSRQVESIAKFKALYTAGDIHITEMVNLTNKSGLYVDFSKSKTANRITAASKLYRIFKAVSPSDFVEILSIIKEAWCGIPESLNTEILSGVYAFYIEYKGNFDKEMLVKQLAKVSPVVITREGKAFSGGGDVRFARQILEAYNKNLSRRRLKDKF